MTDGGKTWSIVYGLLGLFGALTGVFHGLDNMTGLTLWAIGSMSLGLAAFFRTLSLEEKLEEDN